MLKAFIANNPKRLKNPSQNMSLLNKQAVLVYQ